MTVFDKFTALLQADETIWGLALALNSWDNGSSPTVALE